MKRNLCEQAGLFTSFAQLCICICICIFFAFVFVNWVERLRFCLKKNRSGQRKEKDKNKESLLQTKNLRQQDYFLHVLDCFAGSSSVKKILTIKRTKKSDKKTRKPLAEGEYASKQDHFLHLLNSIFVFGRKPLAEERELSRASRIISFIISFKCIALPKYCTSSQGHHGTFDMKQIPKEPNINYGLHGWQNIKKKIFFQNVQTISF